MNYVIIPGIKAAFKDQSRPDLTKELIVDIVCSHFDFTVADLNKNSRTRPRVFARYLIFYFLRKYTKLSLKEIADVFHKDHTTCIHGLQSLQDQIDTDPDTKMQVENIEAQILMVA